MTLNSPDPTQVHEGLRQWAAYVVDDDASVVQWTDEPRRAIPGMTVLLDHLAERVVGQDARTHTFDSTAEPGREVVRRVGGPRVMTLSLALEGYDQRFPEGPFARAAAASARAQGRESIKRLRALGFSLVDVQGPVNARRIEGSRAYPRGVLDVRLGYTRVELDAPTTWIETVRLTTRLRDADGSLLPSPPNRELEIATETP